MGLGNPGPNYALTRHNVGFQLLDRFAAERHVEFRADARFFGQVTQVDVAGRRCRMLKPMTFMNRSGQGVAALAGYFDIAEQAILVVHDDLDLAPGTVRFKRGGGHGGHNGLRDLLAQLGCGGFARLRIGIGHPGNRADVTPYVLGRAPATEQQAIELALERALDALPDLVEGRFEEVMCWLHRKDVDDPTVTDEPGNGANGGGN